MDLGLFVSLLLQGGRHCLVLPANHMAPQVGKYSYRLQMHNLEGSRNHHPLILIIGQQDPIKHLVVVQGP